jgi:hypothetical protein
MKVVVSVLTALLVVTLGVGVAFYLITHKPLAADHARMKAALPAYEMANAELKRIQWERRKETAWLHPAIDVLSAGLGKEIKSGAAEVFVAGNKVIVNISEQALFVRGAYTFAKESPTLRLNLAALLKSDTLKGKNMYVGNVTRAVPARGKGRRRVPAKSARTLAAERSAALVKDLEKNGVDRDRLIAAAYSGKQRVIGFKIKEQKTVIIIESPPMVAIQQEDTPQTAAQPAIDSRISMTAPATPSASLTQPEPVPINPAQP